jgi:hypothetical protein
VRAFLAVFILWLPISAFADVEVRSLQPGAAPPAAHLGDLAWLEGTWIGTGFGGYTEESFSSPKGGAILATFRLVKDDKPGFYEFFTIIQEDKSLVLRIKHFNPDLVGWEEKDKTVDFKLVALEPNAAYFDGLSYKRVGDKLFGAVLIGHGSGKGEVEQFSYKLAR